MNITPAVQSAQLSQLADAIIDILTWQQIVQDCPRCTENNISQPGLVWSDNDTRLAEQRDLFVQAEQAQNHRLDTPGPDQPLHQFVLVQHLSSETVNSPNI